MLQINALGWLVSEVSWNQWDLGSIPRSPPFLNIFWLNVIPCSSNPRAYHAFSCLRLPRAHWSQSNGHDLKDTICLGEWSHTPLRKVNQASNDWA